MAKRNTRKAITALKKINAPVYDHLAGVHGCEFIIGGELRTNDDEYFADYYQETIRERWDRTDVPISERRVINAFGVRQDVVDILDANGLWSEWINAGQLGIYQK